MSTESPLRVAKEWFAVTSFQNNKCHVMQVETDVFMDGALLDERSLYQNGSAVDEDRLAGNEVRSPRG